MTTAPTVPTAKPVAMRKLGLRRLAMAALVLATVAGLGTLMAALLGGDGLDPVEIVLLAFFVMTTPWIVIGFWNATIGFALLVGSRDPVAAVAPIWRARHTGRAAATGRTAIVMPVHNEEPARVFAHLAAMLRSLDRTGEAGRFDLFLLSDSTDARIAAEEEARFAALKAAHSHPDRLVYRRRHDNAGHKAGNIRDFCERWGDAYAYMLVLDADSLMTGDAMVRLADLMDAHPQTGIIQTLVVGLPTDSAFARLFQFGMRHGMRAHATGAAWWQGPDGPYWGHNAIIRLAPFVTQCRLPALPGRPPLGGQILSHDQVEAAMMRSAGYAVWALPVEDGSYEENPPTLPDFIKRDLRWCQGNMQYFQLLARPGFRPMGRVQLALAILMYLIAPFWMGFLALGFANAAIGGIGLPVVAAFAPVPEGAAIGLLVATMALIFAPKLLGFVQVLLSARLRRLYGGLPRLVAGGLAELLFSILLAPAVSLTQAIFVVGLLFGRCVRWDAQHRGGRAIPLAEAARGLWPQALAGLAGTAALALWAPHVLPWASPVLAAFVLAIPLASVTSRRRVGEALARIGLCAIPEELAPPAEVIAAGHALSHIRPVAATDDGAAADLPAMAGIEQPEPARMRA